MPWFAKGDWSAWRSFLSAAFGLPMTTDQLAIYQQCTGRTTPPTRQCAEAWAIAGRRGGKSRIMSLCAAWLAAFCDWRDYLAPGEVATCHVLAANRKQARVVFRYIGSLFIDHPVVARLVTRETEDTLELTNKVVIEVQTANYRVVRGYSICAVIADEIAFWLSDEDAANPAAEIIDGLRPAMATMPNAMLMVATSPTRVKARSGTPGASIISSRMILSSSGRPRPGR
jgi:phage terminase large subunit-like protein